MTAKTGLGVEDIIGDRREQILKLAQAHGVSNVRVFGSVVRGEATPDSDLDLLVDGLENAAWGGGRLLMDLQELLGRRVDLVSEGDLHQLIRDRVLKEAQPL
ncbi:MAG TPA: nucleotidyltransferase family protein [Spirillospora sp.]|jgi:predicted nucleotidyltransferase|nr:nucleotidyltransferase family protein [Spirillospora sp.]